MAVKSNSGRDSSNSKSDSADKDLALTAAISQLEKRYGRGVNYEPR